VRAGLTSRSLILNQFPLRRFRFVLAIPTETPNDPGMKLENLVACALLKEMHFREDCLGEKWNMYYLRCKDGREVDFFVTREDQPSLMIEVKWSDSERSPNLSFFEKFLTGTQQLQIVKELKREKTYPDGVEIRSAQNWLSEMRF
jgi:uncharacterized protein